MVSDFTDLGSNRTLTFENESWIVLAVSTIFLSAVARVIVASVAERGSIEIK